MILRASLLLCCTVLLVACGPTHQEVADEYRERVLEKKAAIVAAAKHLQAHDKDSVPSCEDVSVPLVHSSYGGKSDTDFAMLDWVLHLDDPDYKVPFSLTDAYRLEKALQWSSDDNPWRSIRDKRAKKEFREIFEHTLGLRYLALNTARNFQKPRVVSGDSFLPGSVDITTYVMAIEPPNVLCRAEFTATTANEVTASSFSKFPDLTSANLAVRMSLSDDARRKLSRILKKLSDDAGQ
jgi:hypothetical protein